MMDDEFLRVPAAIGRALVIAQLVEYILDILLHTVLRGEGSGANA